MTDDPAQAPLQFEAARRLAPAFALAVAIVAVATDPGSTVDLVLAAIPVAAFAIWAFVPRVPLWALTVAVIVPVVAGQRSGAVEPLLFDVSLLALIIGRWAPSRAAAIALGIAALAAPVASGMLQDPSEIAVGIWIMGIAFPLGMGVAAARQSQLTAQLDRSRRELAEQALLSERRRIARDVHDFVGHGLAAVMLQITSARHVLRRDPAAAEEALLSAEEVGRHSMQELRRTVALLRSDDEAAVAPLPSATEIAALADHARAGGLVVELRTQGDLSRIEPAVGVALYRIAQEALANAARHAPRARTVLTIEAGERSVDLTAESIGVATNGDKSDPDRPRYGLIGMRERANALGGELTAGPTAEGWQLSCRLPLVANDGANGGPGRR